MISEKFTNMMIGLGIIILAMIGAFFGVGPCAMETGCAQADYITGIVTALIILTAGGFYIRHRIKRASKKVK